MAELVVIRHAQASFGAEDYDVLSDLGHRQADMAGAYLTRCGWVPDRVVLGSLRRHAQTFAQMGIELDAEIDAGFNEYDFHDLLAVRFGGKIPDLVAGDRRAHFRTLRDTLADWQKGGLAAASESWNDFADRVDRARRHATRDGGEKVLVISSGGPIGQLVAATLGCPRAAMINLNLQIKNSAISRFIFSKRAFYLHEFNTTPHLDLPENAYLRSYS